MDLDYRIQNLSDASIRVWAPKLGAQIKRELMQNNVSHLMISSTQMGQHVLRHLTYVKNVELKTLCKPGSVYRLYKRIQHFRCTGVSKRSPG